MSNNQANKLATISILSSFGFVLMLIEIPTFTEFLKFDLSDLVVFVTAIIFGPFSAIAVAFIKSVLHYLVKGSIAGVPINQLIAFTASVAYMLPFYLVAKFFVKKNFHHFIKRLIPVFVAIVFFTLTMTVLNYHYFTPWYFKLLGFSLPNEYLKFIVSTYIPFNLLKSIVLSIVFILLSYRLNYLVDKFEICDSDNCLIIK